MKKLPPFRDRLELLRIVAQSRTPLSACEVGVLRGDYARAILDTLITLQCLYLVDSWLQQDNYIDSANVSNDLHTINMNATKQMVAPYASKVKILRGQSVDMASSINDDSLDFVYIDARHDYKGCYEDLQSYWPKLRDGGVMAGHDYMTAAEVCDLTPEQDWSLCYDGTINDRAVKGAVDDFADFVDRQVLVSYRDQAWNTWAMIK